MQFADKVDVSEVQVINPVVNEFHCISALYFLSSCARCFFFMQDDFSAVITKALLTLVHGLETKFDAEMIAMTRVPWATLESVGDQSE